MRKNFTNRPPALALKLWSRLIGILPMLIILAASLFGGWRLWHRGIADTGFEIGVSTATGAENFSPEAQSEFARLNHCATGKNLLSPSVMFDVRAEYEHSAWVKKVLAVERVFPNRLRVIFVPRYPYLQVAFAENLYLVDDENILLAAEQFARPLLPLICGDIPAQPRAGEKWGEIDAAYQALITLEQSPLAAQLPVREIRLIRARYHDKFRQPQQSRPRLEITTRNDIHILWGAATDDAPAEISPVSAEDKIVMLAQLLQKPPRHRRLISLDVRTAVPGYALRHAP